MRENLLLANGEVVQVTSVYTSHHKTINSLEVGIIVFSYYKAGGRGIQNIWLVVGC